MNFNSVDFLVYYPIVLLFYFLLPKKLTWIWLLLVSYWFYMSWNPQLIVLILFTTAVSYGCGLATEKSKKQSTKRLLLVTTLAVCLGVLFFFKYFNFVGDSINAVISSFGGKGRVPVLDLILPVGISFYTFQTLSYVIDVYRGTLPAEHHFGYYALYVSFFPQLVAGPIERPENLLPQLKKGNPLTPENLREGFRIMVLGFFKKVVVADLLAVYADRIFNDPASANGPMTVIATLFFTVQIYCDFSGYTDIAIGCARVMGIRLMENFNLPYTATSIKDFWARWHISLSSWFKDYLYFPLGGSRCKRWRHLMNLMIVFLVSGLWHGASWHFVLWGALHGFYQVIGILLTKPRKWLCRKLRINEEKGWYTFAQRVVTFLLVAFAWLLFRVNSTADMAILVPSILTGWSVDGIRHGLQAMELDLQSILLSLGSILAMVLMDRAVKTVIKDEGAEHAEEKLLVLRGSKKVKQLSVMQLVPWVAAVWAIALAWIILISQGGSGTFIYFQF